MCYNGAMPNLSLRISEQDEERLDRLVVAVRAYYERMSATLPIAAQMARETTRSSALRDLLMAWERGEANELFSRDITKEIT